MTQILPPALYQVSPLSQIPASVGFFPAATAPILDDTTCVAPWFSRGNGFSPVQTAPFVKSFSGFNCLGAFWSFATAKYFLSTTDMPDESTPKQRRGDTENPDSHDVPGDTGRTGPNYRKENWDSPGSGSGWEPGLGGSGNGNEPI